MGNVGKKAAPKQRAVTAAGKLYMEALTEWLQDTRLMSEAAFRLFKDFEAKGTVAFDNKSWPKRKASESLPDFSIKPMQLAQRMETLLTGLWSNRFVFLESLWEEYLQELVKELRHKDASIFEPFCEKEFMADIVREVLTDRLASIDDIKDEAAARFAAGITRQPWEAQWKQLIRLEIGLTEKDKDQSWFNHLGVYFEMRNCIIHLQCRVSPILNKRTPYYKDNGITNIEVWPIQLDFFRHQFISCLLFIEDKIAAKYKLS